MKLYKITEFAELINRSPQTLRQWDKKGTLKPIRKTERGDRFYTEEQLNYFLDKDELSVDKDKKVIGYCRVSSNKQKDDLSRQIDNVKTYMIANGYSFDIISDIGSGINYKKDGLNKLLKMIINDEVQKVIVLYKDRLVRFGFELIETICKLKNVELIIIDNSEKNKEEELVEDLIQIITVFSARLNGTRVKKTKKLINELKNNI